MSKLSEIRADLALKALLEGNVKLNDDEIEVYGQYEMPNKGVGSDFIRIYYNGNPKALTKPIGFFSGNLAVAVYCESNTNNTAKRNRMNYIVSQIEELANEKESEGYFFELSPTPITPITVSDTTGYGLTTLNFEWREL
jgi:hypothetical protein